MLRFSKATASAATLVCELALLAGCARTRTAPAPAELHSGPVSAVIAKQKTAAAARPAVNKITQGVVSVTIAVQSYDLTTPWAKQRPSTRWVTGMVVEGKRILITGGSVGNATLVQVQKDGLPKKYTAQVDLVDYEIPLALLKVEDEAFWKGLEPMPIAEVLPREGAVTIYRWLSSGQLEDAPGKIRQVRSSDHWPGRSNILTLDITTQIDNAGFSEVVLAGGNIVGLSTVKSENQLEAIGGPMLRTFLDNSRVKPYPGTARGGYGSQRLTNPALRKSLGLADESGGVLITEVLPHGSVAGVLQPGDVLLGINGHAIDSIGMFDHPLYGRMASSVLLTDGMRPGDSMELEVFRAGKKSKLRTTLKRMRAEDDRVPPYTFDQAPDYHVAGGFLFQHLTRTYLQTWREWWKRAPLRLLIAHDEEGNRPSTEDPRIVVLTKVLADPVNLGYQDLGPMIVRSVNGKAVRTLDQLRAAMQSPVDGFHVFEFLPGQGPRRVVVDAAEVAAAETRIREAYGIDPAVGGGK